AGGRAATERAEELHAVVEARGNLARGDDRAERIAIRNRFPQHDDVGDDALGFEGPEVRAEAPEARLHLIGNAHTAGAPHRGVRVCKVPGRRDDLAADARTRLSQETAQAPSLRSK